MAKKLLLFFIFLNSLCTFGQSIGILGSATPTGWNSDTDMVTSDNVTYTITMTFVTGEAKFRQDDAWTTNWGANAFPSGTGTQDGPNIPVPAGTYNVTFNRTTGQYSFVGSATFPSVGILGTALPDDFNGPDTDMSTSDGVTYTLSGYTFEAGEAKFRQDDAWTINWGGSTFPSGSASQDGPNIPVPAGTFTVTFNRTTLAYNFGYVSIGIIGDAVNGWNDDVDMMTADGVVFTLTNFTLQNGFVKFRQDDSWTYNWGGDGTTPNMLVQGGADIPVTAGNYDISMNRNTLEYSITPSLGISENNKKMFAVFPNPAKAFWTFASSSEEIASIAIYDISGKRIVNHTPNSRETTIDCTGLSKGIYFATIASAQSVQTVKLIKE